MRFGLEAHCSRSLFDSLHGILNLMNAALFLFMINQITITSRYSWLFFKTLFHISDIYHLISYTFLILKTSNLRAPNCDIIVILVSKLEWILVISEVCSYQLTYNLPFIALALNRSIYSYKLQNICYYMYWTGYTCICI